MALGFAKKKTVDPPSALPTADNSPVQKITIQRRTENGSNASVISELTYPIMAPENPAPQTPATTTPQQQQQQHPDPPGELLRYTMTDPTTANNNNTVNKQQDPPAETPSSLVTKVLGMVDMSCVSSPFPTTPGTAATTPETVSSNNSTDSGQKQAQWGMPPTDTFEDNKHNELPGPSPLLQKTKEDSNLICVTPTESHQSHLQFNVPPPPQSMDPNTNKRHENFELVYKEPKKKRPTTASVPAKQTTPKKESFFQKLKKNKKSPPKIKDNERVKAVLGIAPRDEKAGDYEFVPPPQRLVNAAASPALSSPTKSPRSPKKSPRSSKPPARARSASPPKSQKVEQPQRRSMTPQKTRSSSSSKAVGTTQSSPPPAANKKSGAKKMLKKAFLSSKNNNNSKSNNKKDDDSSKKKSLKAKQQPSTEIPPVPLPESPPRTEEADNDSSSYNADCTGVAPRYRKVLKSIKNPVRAPLDTVEEASAEEDLSLGDGPSSDEGFEFLVRVPGTKSYLSDKDLIGEEVVDEKEEELLHQQRMEQQQQLLLQEEKKEEIEDEEDELMGKMPTIERSTNRDSIFKPTRPASPICDENKTPFIESRDKFLEDDNRDVGSPKRVVKNCKSWTNKLVGKIRRASSQEQPSDDAEKSNPAIDNDGDDTHSLSDSESLTRNRLAPEKLLSERYIAAKMEKVKRTRPMWKAVVDQASGKTYYYHRKTRETTWTRPPENEIVQPKQATPSDSAQAVAAAATEALAVQPNLRKKKPRDFDPGVWEKKQEIARLLTKQKIDLPNTVEQFLQDNEGREDEVLNQLREMCEARPFDEPLDTDASVTMTATLFESSLPDNSQEDEDGEEEKDSDDDKLHPLSSRTLSRSRTGASIYSGFSGKFSSSTQKTLQIRNTASNKPTPILPEPSNNIEPAVRRRHPPLPEACIPKNIPVPRQRELAVEEFTTRDPVYGCKDVHRVREKQQSQQQLHPSPPQLLQQQQNPGKSSVVPSQLFLDHQQHTRQSSYEPDAYLGDNEETDNDKDTASAYETNDSISALSDNDLDFVDRPHDRRLLQEALRQRDWDRAAAISERMRRQSSRDGLRHPPPKWAQSELDRFISQNDWDAVATYIAQIRMQDLRRQRDVEESSGAPSNSSYSSYSSYTTDYTSGTYFSEEEPPNGLQHMRQQQVLRNPPPKRKPKEFAC